MVIITKKPADDLFYMMPVDKNGVVLPITSPDARTQRPLIGARIENAVFFNIHGKPNRDNETPAMLEKVQAFMAAPNYKHFTWSVSGDFNMIPSEFESKLNERGRPPANTFREIVSTGVVTNKKRPGRPGQDMEFDFAVIGGPVAKRNIQVTASIRNEALTTLNPSDHSIVGFNF